MFVSKSDAKVRNLFQLCKFFGNYFSIKIKIFLLERDKSLKISVLINSDFISILFFRLWLCI